MPQPAYQPHHSSAIDPRRVLVVRRTPLRVKLALVSLLLFATYIAFCVLSLSPYAKQEFVNIFLNPDFRLLGDR